MKDKFFEVLREALEMEDGEIKMEDKFREYPEWGSLALLSLIAELDEEFEVAIETKDFEKLQTVEDLYNEVVKRSEK